jgi:Holliday junction resolvase RusA-like endonuclease
MISLTGCEVCRLAIQRPATRCSEHGGAPVKPPASIRIELVGEPRGKGRPRFTRAGMAYTPAKTRSYEAALQLAAQDAMAGRPPLEGPLTLIVEAHMPIPASWSGKQQKLAAAGQRRPTGRPDFDNLLKPLDALNKVVWSDDAQVVDVRCVKLYSERPRLIVTVEHATTTAAAN